MNGKLAILSPASNAYSETFIQSHRELNNGDVVFYYGGLGEIKLDGKGRVQNDLSKVSWRVLGQALGKSKLDIQKSLESSFRKNDVSSLLIEYGTFGAELIPYLSFFKGRIIVHFHGYDAASYDVIDRYKEEYQVLFDRVHEIVVVSKKMYEMLLELGAPESKLHLNTYGPHPDFFKLAPSYSSRQLVFVGRLVDKKSPYYLVLLMVELVKEVEDVRLIVVGEGVLYQTLRDLIKFYNLEDHVLLKGRQTREEILDIFASSALLVQHSVRAVDGDMEGTPNSVLEASAAGLPVLSTFHAGIPDVVEHLETGLLVEEHDLKAMISYAKELIPDENRLRKMGEAGRQKILGSFTQEMYLNKLDQIVNGVE